MLPIQTDEHFYLPVGSGLSGKSWPGELPWGKSPPSRLLELHSLDEHVWHCPEAVSPSALQCAYQLGALVQHKLKVMELKPGLNGWCGWEITEISLASACSSRDQKSTPLPFAWHWSPITVISEGRERYLTLCFPLCPLKINKKHVKTPNN